MRRSARWAFLVLAAASAARAESSRHFAIHVVDADTGRGVPLAYLRTTYKQQYVTDSAGYVAFDEPGLMDGRDVWFDVQSYGYEPPAGAFGIHGVGLKPKPGETAEVKLKRTQVAERLYRLTGYGIYRDSVLLGVKPPLSEPTINAHVAGQDTVQTAVYRGKYFWLWQDTDRLSFPLGCFSMTGAVAMKLPGEVDVDRGIDFTYFVDKPGEFSRAMADVPRKEANPIWVDGLVVTKDEKGNEKMVGRYFAANPDFSVAEGGLVVYDDARERFVRLKQFEGTGAGVLAPCGRPYKFRENGHAYVGFVEGAGVRVRDTFEAVSDPSAYEVFTCLASDGKTVGRAPDGTVRWRWERGGKRLDAKAVEALVKAGQLKPDERPFRLRDVDGGKAFRMASGSIAWNPHLKRWLLLCEQQGGESALGELWVAVSDSPQGPWADAMKVATHAMKGNNNSLYNPIWHDDLAREGGRFVCFSGTFVNSFSGNEHATPYYDYNNILYRVDLDDPRMKLPEPPRGLTSVEPIAPTLR